MKKIILTFDDGPSSKFKQLLDYLTDNKHKAIFFILGKEVDSKNEKFLIKAINKGFLIGNHSYSHPNFSKILFEEAKKEILKTDKIIENLYRKSAKKRTLKIFRFPFGSQGGSNKSIIQKFLKELGYKNPYYKNYSFLMKKWRAKQDLFWHLDPKDWSKDTTPEKAISRIKKAKNKDIIDMHDHTYSFNHFIKPVCEFLSSEGFELIY